MADCEGCTAAESNPLSGLVLAHCNECAARSIAKSHPYWVAMRADAMTPDYRSALQLIFGADWQNGHTMARAWADKLAGVKA